MLKIFPVLSSTFYMIILMVQQNCFQICIQINFLILRQNCSFRSRYWLFRHPDILR